MSDQISKTHKSVMDGFFLAELNELSPAKATTAVISHLCVQRILCVSHPQEVPGRCIHELTTFVQNVSKFPKNSFELQMQTWVHSAVVQCEILRYKLLGGLAIRQVCLQYASVCHGIRCYAVGRKVVVSDRLHAALGKSIKFTTGSLFNLLMISLTMVSVMYSIKVFLESRSS